MGILESTGDGFGLEGAGIVRRTGRNVNMKAGDRVMFISRGAFGTHVVVSENLCEVIPDGLSFEDAAAMPCVFATSIHSLFNIGNLKKGQVCLSSTIYTHWLASDCFLVCPHSQCLWWDWHFRYPAFPDGWC